MTETSSSLVLALRPPALSDALHHIRQIDFSMIVAKLAVPSPTLAHTWTASSARLALAQYRRFLWLLRRYGHDPDVMLVPSPDIDEMWHHHILDTQKYHVDCLAIFGRYQHHFPYFGMRGPADEAALRYEYSQTQELYFAEFDEYIWEIPAGLADGVMDDNDAAYAFPPNVLSRIEAEVTRRD